jgi:hypothetical protein
MAWTVSELLDGIHNLWYNRKWTVSIQISHLDGLIDSAADATDVDPMTLPIG